MVSTSPRCDHKNTGTCQGAIKNMAKLFTMASKCTDNLVSIYATHSPLCNLCSTKGSLQLPHSLLTLKPLFLCTLFPLLSNEHLVWLEPLLETSLPLTAQARAALTSLEMTGRLTDIIG